METFLKHILYVLKQEIGTNLRVFLTFQNIKHGNKFPDANNRTKKIYIFSGVKTYYLNQLLSLQGIVATLPVLKI